MTKKRIVAYYLHEGEKEFALDQMPSGITTESYVVGEADAQQVTALRERGLIVQEVGEAEKLATPPEFEALHGVVRASVLGAEVSRIPRAPTVTDLTEPQFFLVGLLGPLLEEWRARFAELGVDLMEAFPTGAYKVRLDPDQVQKVSALPFVSYVRLFDSLDTGPNFATRESATRPRGAPPGSALAMLSFDIRLHRPEDRQIVLDWLKERRISIAGSSGKKIRVYLLANDPAINDIPALPEVASFEEYVVPRLNNDLAREILGIDSGITGSSILETGAEQIVAVADTGIDEKHPDFKNRIVGTVALGRPGNSSDPHGHGTHVAGSVLGDGDSSHGALRGAAPGAQLFFQSLLDAQGELGGLPLDLADLFDEAYRNGARIHNNSWGAATGSRYTINSTEVDDFVARYRDMLIVISAGNEGTAIAPRTNSAPGFVDWLSIGSPASCKNALTVGASRSNRTEDGYSTLTYGTAWPGDFPDAPIADHKVSGDPQCLAAFSSRGPCDDRRIKPDLVAPGTDIASTKSRLAPLRNFWGPYPGNANYAFMGGTSMAAPLVSGCAALVREYYTTKRQHEPSAALLKATLINGTVWLSGQDATAPAPGMPNFHQGFGRVSMTDTIPNSLRPRLTVEFIDNWKSGVAEFTVTGERRRFRLLVNSSAEPLRICLAYTDLPARALQNNLNLFVETPAGTKVMGNAQLPNSLHIPDPDNNVERVRIEDPPVGTYLIQISASNLLKGPQDFALVVTGEGISSLVQI